MELLISSKNFKYKSEILKKKKHIFSNEWINPKPKS